MIGKKTPFKTKGIYAREIINPEMVIPYYKPTKLGSIWKIIVGEEELPYYEIISFYEDIGRSEDDFGEKEIFAEYKRLSGEILEIADRCTGGSVFSPYHYKQNKVLYSENRFEFENKDYEFSGNLISIRDDVFIVNITNKETGELISREFMRYIPFVKIFL